MSSTLAVDPGMHLPNLPEQHRVHAVLRGRLPEPPYPQLEIEDAPHAYWPAEMFGLERVWLYRHSAPSLQRAVLEHCGRSLLEEAYFIEKAGISFAALMVLLGETVEERMLYAMFASEEVRHFDGVRSFMHGPIPQRAEGSFLTLLSDVISCSDRATLQLTIQVVLEGWGLSHYRTLRDGCLDASLKQLLDGILLDEAGHHGSGRVFFSTHTVDEQALTRIEDVVAPMLRMVQLGPQAVLSALDQAHGGLRRTQRVRVFKELEGSRHAQLRLEQLRQLLRFESLRPLVARLESRTLFSPLAPEDCV